MGRGRVNGRCVHAEQVKRKLMMRSSAFANILSIHRTQNNPSRKKMESGRWKEAGGGGGEVVMVVMVVMVVRW